jgi:5'-nucleotidase
MKTKKILITNDDGVDSPGLLALAIEMQKFGEVTILAPDRNWSASGHVRTLDRPMRVKETHLAGGFPAFAADGSPADCVALGARGFLPAKPDLVVSGINTSANLGQDVSYSGTVAAALEAAVWGIPAVAISQDAPNPQTGTRDYSAAAYYARLVVENADRYHLNPEILLNVNVPTLPMEQILGIRSTRLGKRTYFDRVERRADPRGKPYYWIVGEPPAGAPESGTDIGAVADGFVSVTPLQLDMTAYLHLFDIASWDWCERIEVQVPKQAIHFSELKVVN